MTVSVDIFVPSADDWLAANRWMDPAGGRASGMAVDAPAVAYQPQMALLGVLAEVDCQLILGDPMVPVTGLAYDPARAQLGEVFVALPGHDDPAALAEAYGNGVRAFVVGDRPGDCLQPGGDGVSLVRVDDTRRALALMSRHWFGFPEYALTVVALVRQAGGGLVEGPAGSADEADEAIAQSLWLIAETTGWNIGLFASRRPVGPGLADRSAAGWESPDLHRELSQMVSAGMDAVVLDLTGDDFARHRTDGMRFDLGVVTGASPDPDELLATRRVFTQSDLCLVNRDIACYRQLTRNVLCPIQTYGRSPGADHPTADAAALAAIRGLGLL